MEIAPDGVWEDNFYRTLLDSREEYRLLQESNSPAISPLPESADYLPIPENSPVKFPVSEADPAFSATQIPALSVSYKGDSQIASEREPDLTTPRGGLTCSSSKREV